MPESTLSLKVQDLWADVGVFLGWGAGNADQTGHADLKWTDREFDKIKGFVKSGLRRFYFPMVGQTGVSHSWSFLSPTATVTLVSGEKTAALPDDFGGLEGVMTLGDSGTRPCTLRTTGVADVDQRHAEVTSSSGSPQLVAIRPRKGTTPERGQRSELYFYPTADADYTLRLNYYLLAGALDGNSPYAYGGAAHAETILESCLAVAEERQDDLAGGPHAQAFAQCLAASISLDRRNAPSVLGNLREQAILGENYDSYHRYQQQTVTFGGTQY